MISPSRVHEAATMGMEILLSEAAGFITGQRLVADGGWSAWMSPIDESGPQGGKR